MIARTAKRLLLAATALLGLVACERPGMPELSDGPHIVQASELERQELDALYPTDLLLQDGGQLWVLDGHDRRIIRLDERGQELEPYPVPSWSRPSRMATATQGGTWLADPLGHLLRIDDDGVIQQNIADPFDETELEPVAVAEQDGAVLLSDRWGGLVEVDPASGSLGRGILSDHEDRPLRMVTDLVALPGGGVLAVDALRSSVFRVEDGQVVGAWGQFGMWAGALMKPKALAPGPHDTVLVADTALDVIQLFTVDGTHVGMLADDQGEPLHFDHAVAIEPAGQDQYLVLDAASAAVVRLRLSADQVSAAIERARATHALRYPLRADDQGDYSVTGDEGDTCLQCHDGLVLDDRQVWDSGLAHHPVNVIPDEQLPAFFPLGEDGSLRCSTCHSPHGTAAPSEVEAVDSEDERLEMARHWSKDEFFTRLSRGDSALCEACHTDAAHDQAIERLELGGSAHIVGKELEQALAKRYEGQEVLPEEIEKGCLGCHAPHAAQSTSLLRAAGDGKGCISCHEPHADPRRSHPVGGGSDQPQVQAAAEIPLDHDGQVDCLSCHQPVGGSADALLREPADGSQLCLACHEDQVGMVNGPHGRVRGTHDLSCLGCHDVHDQASASLLAISPGGASDPLGCLSCHAPGKRHATRGVNPGKRGHPVDGQVHEGMQGEALTCQSCHDPHRPEPVGCDGCHQDQAAAAGRGGHGSAECLDCHPAHSDPPLVEAPGHNPRSWTCLACHGAKVGRTDAPKVAEFEHPAPVFEPDGTRWEPLGTLPLFAPDGSAQGKGVNGDMACETCHMVHGPDTDQPKAKLKRPGWEKPCAACHGDNALILYRYFHQPARREGVDTTSR